MSLTDFPLCTVAHRLEHAAQIIKANGLYQDGGYWPSSTTRSWKPGMPCCVVGAFAIGRDYQRPLKGLLTPEYAALRHHLCRSIENSPGKEPSVADWSDTATSAQVVIDALLGAARWEREHGDRCE